MKKKRLKWVLAVLIVAVCSVILCRMYFSVPHGDMKRLHFTPQTEAAYLANGGSLHVNEQRLMSYISKSGFLQVRSIYYVAESRELQMTVYYNARAKTSFALPEEKNGEFPFAMELHLCASGDTGREEAAAVTAVCSAFRVEEMTTHWMYRFARITFSDVTLTDAATVWLHMALDGLDVDNMLVYHRDMEFLPYDYERDVPKALAQQAKTGATETPGATGAVKTSKIAITAKTADDAVRETKQTAEKAGQEA